MMRILLAPAKKMREDAEDFAPRSLPRFLGRAEELTERLREMSYAELRKLWRCSDAVAAPCFERLQAADLRRNLTPALFAYEGIAYQYLAPGVFTDGEFSYIEERLRILSGLYGVLRPFDGVAPYRLEMGARLCVGSHRDLYGYWGGALAQAVAEDCDFVVDLASREYSRAVLPHLPAGVRVVTVVFGERQGGRIVEKGTLCKMARGAMVRHMAEHRITAPEQLRDFERLGYRFCAAESTAAVYTFLRTQAAERGNWDAGR